MISKINEVVISSLKNYNLDFQKLAITNNILTLGNEKLDLKEFNLDSLFDSYQLKLDLQNISSTTLFNIIKINTTLYNSDILNKFNNLLKNTEITEELIQYLKFMTKDVHDYQFYLTNSNFKIYQEFRKICYSLEEIAKEKLTSTQRKTLEYFHSSAKEIPTFTITSNNEDEGIPRKYTANGFISAMLLIGGAVGFGLIIASIFLVQI